MITNAPGYSRTLTLRPGGPLNRYHHQVRLNPWKARQGADSTESRNTIAPKNHNTRKNREHTRKLYNSCTTEGGKE